ncbi:hypothetical protein SAMN05428995_101855 [Loktanella sp. DSM 29012]|uniref:LPXTG-motif cell wall-anchored protein n=1 Tax=Loktanella gaetbuli TaxID=2881335 RepID=A0ABS8BX58_9RHOB|nr:MULTISPECIES: DUF6732 family protein [Loktanella]MCB5200159.1 hypothetical protein [Loktanella gaetbuli]SEP80447.1 hypothetical protein SAMN05428995_101855 [Loktanella sp. DSM 29012]
MRLLTVTLILTGTTAAAHPGHIVDAAGHNHWVAGIALGAAGLAALLGALKGRKTREKKATPKSEEQPA